MSCSLNYYPFLKLNYLRTFCKMEARCLNKTLEYISDLCKKFSGVLTGVLAVVLAVVLPVVLAVVLAGVLAGSNEFSDMFTDNKVST